MAATTHIDRIAARDVVPEVPAYLFVVGPDREPVRSSALFQCECNI